VSRVIGISVHNDKVFVSPIQDVVLGITTLAGFIT